MVNRKVLEKLSNQELNNYLKPESRYVAEAIEMAFEILKKRNVTFDTSETESIKSLIEKRREDEAKAEEDLKLDLQDFETQNPEAFPLQSRNLIFGFSMLFGTFAGSLLLAQNCYKLNKKSEAVTVIAFGIIYTLMQVFLFSYFEGVPTKTDISIKKSPEMLFAILGSFILYVVWSDVVPKKFEYRQASYLLPIIVGIVMLGLIVLNFKNLFSSFLIHRIIETFYTI